MTYLRHTIEIFIAKESEGQQRSKGNLKKRERAAKNRGIREKGQGKRRQTEGGRR
jgi:hypothetical protein